ncbi:hypothetical protein BDW62DRAFT_183686 [Aspergillus aurantiobrunneus]
MGNAASPFFAENGRELSLSVLAGWRDSKLQVAFCKSDCVRGFEISAKTRDSRVKLLLLGPVLGSELRSAPSLPDRLAETRENQGNGRGIACRWRLPLARKICGARDLSLPNDNGPGVDCWSLPQRMLIRNAAERQIDEPWSSETSPKRAR